jgi:membrane protein
VKLHNPYQHIASLTNRFIADDCYGKAASLSYYTLMSIVPLLAIAFGIAKGFGFEELLENEIMGSFAQQRDLASKIVLWAKNALENAHGSLIAGVGVVLLFWSSIGLIGQMENSLNVIWQIRSSRTWAKKMVDYLPLLIFGPIFLVLTSSLSFFIISQVVKVSIALGVYSGSLPAIYALYYLLLLLIAWVFFTVLYLYLPNQSLPWKANFEAAFLAAVGFQLGQIGYIHFQLFISNYNAIYGSFAAVPLFLIWVQLSWLIALAGAEIAAYRSGRGPRKEKPEDATGKEECLALLTQCLQEVENHQQTLKQAKDALKHG